MTDQDRLREVVFAAVDALREVVRDKEITEDELHAAGAFLDRVGTSGLFRSMLDIGFAMTVMDRIRGDTPGTRPNLEGPEYRAGAPTRPDGSLLEHDRGPGARLLTLSGQVTDAHTGAPIEGAEVDFWHADENGGYDRVGYHLRGVVVTDAHGRYTARTLLPTDYAEHEGDAIGELLENMGRTRYRAAHIHLKVRIGGEVRLTTQVFDGGSPYLEQDYVVGAVSDDLIIRPEPDPQVAGGPTLRATFDIGVTTAGVTAEGGVAG